MNFDSNIVGRWLGLGLLILVLWVGIASAALIDNGDGTVSDTSTGLMWLQDSCGYLDWQSAIYKCSNLVYPVGGYNDWRLPEREEFKALVDLNCNQSLLGNFFPESDHQAYWTAKFGSTSTFLNITVTTAWSISFRNCLYLGAWNSILHDKHVLAVRSYSGGAYNYYVPYFSSLNNNWTGLGLINCSLEDSTQLQVAVYASDGNLLSAEEKTIPANGQNAFPVAAGANNSGWMFVNSQQPLLGLAFIGLSGAVPLMADIPFVEDLATSMVIPHIAQDEVWDTAVLICNPQDRVNDITLRLIGQDGALLGEEFVELAALGSDEYHLSALFEQAPQKVGKIKINATSGVAAFALYTNTKSGGSYCAGINAVVEGANIGENYNYYLPYYSTKGGDWTGLGLSNSSEVTPSTLQVLVRNNEGSIQDSIQPQPSVAANGQIAFSVKSEIVETGWIQVVSPQPLTGLAFIGVTGAASLTADIPFVEVLNRNLVIPHVAQDSTWDTTILLCNPNDEIASVTIENINQTGEVEGSSQNTIMAYGSGQYLLSTLFAGDTTGKIQITSSTGLAGFALYSNQKTGGSYFAGINAEVGE